MTTEAERSLIRFAQLFDTVAEAQEAWDQLKEMTKLYLAGELEPEVMAALDEIVESKRAAAQAKTEVMH
jgi:hypothetical protein